MNLRNAASRRSAPWGEIGPGCGGTLAVLQAGVPVLDRNGMGIGNPANSVPDLTWHTEGAGMNLLFIHNNFPAQFGHVAARLAQDGVTRVKAIASHTAKGLPGIDMVRYPSFDGDVSGTHPFARRFDLEARRAEQVLYALSGMAQQGFTPDVVVVHPGWGEALPVRAVFPKAKLIVYTEYFYRANGQDVGFDPEFPGLGMDGRVNVEMKNASTLLALAEADRAIAPTRWQRSTFPALFHPLIDVIHEGVDVETLAPNEAARLPVPNGHTLTRRDRVVTFVSRNLEPLRGYHVFMRALPAILAAVPDAHVVVIGGSGTSYGQAPPRGQTWRDIFWHDVEHTIDARRVHFLGRVKHSTYVKALQISSAHIYLSYPFVLSWSMLEAMAVGSLVIGSDTPPVREILNDDNGVIVPFFDSGVVADAAIAALRDPASHSARRRQARQTILTGYDVRACAQAFIRRIRDV